MLKLYLEAPFATCRTFTAGWYRPTATFLSPSAAYGLLLNLAGIESRVVEETDQHDGKTPATYMRLGLPSVSVALGAPAFRLKRFTPVPIADVSERFPRVQSLFQQLHNYPVGAAGEDRAEAAHGNKYNITPVRREFLSDLRVLLYVDGNADLESRIQRGLAGELESNRYGIPFLGDNAFLIDQIVPLPDESHDAHWYERLNAETPPQTRPRTTRLTTWINRSDLSLTQSSLYVPQEHCGSEVPPAAWTRISPPPPPSAPEMTAKGSKPKAKK